MRHSTFLLVFLGLALLLAGCEEPISPTHPIREFSLSTTCGNDVQGPTYACNPTSITAGPDGALWFTEFRGNKIGRITPAGRIQEFPLPTTCANNQGCGRAGIEPGPDGNLWFTESSGNQVGRITPAGRIQEFALPTTCNSSYRCGPAGIASGPDGNLWFAEAAGNRIGQVSPPK